VRSRAWANTAARAAAFARAQAKLVEVLLFPSDCRLCGRLLERPGERIVCEDCLARLTPRRGPACLGCGRFFEGAGEPHLCRRCLDRPPDFSMHRSCARYDGALKDLILVFKYRHMAGLGRPLAAFAERALGDDRALWSGVDAVIPVPLHPRRERERGFNQSAVLARRVAGAKGLRTATGWLVRTKNVPPQATLESAAREMNVRGAFTVRMPGKVRGKTVLLVDDVFTTGATLRECSRVLKAAGAREVRALTLAQA
jgi:competence protein ComFC